MQQPQQLLQPQQEWKHQHQHYLDVSYDTRLSAVAAVAVSITIAVDDPATAAAIFSRMESSDFWTKCNLGCHSRWSQ